MYIVDTLKANPDYIITDNYNEKINNYHLKVIYKGNIIFNESRLIGHSCCGGSIDRLKNIFNILLKTQLQQLNLL